MSASPFRSHLLQQWARSSHGRAPAAVVPWLKKSSQPHRSANHDAENDADECIVANREYTHHKSGSAMPPSISTINSVSLGSSLADSHRSRIESGTDSPTRPASRQFSHASSSKKNATLTTILQAESLQNNSLVPSVNSKSTRKFHSSQSIQEELADQDDSVLNAENSNRQILPGSQSVAHVVQKVLRDRQTATRLVAVDSETSSKEEQQLSLRQALDRAVKCAQMAPNHKRTEPFSFRRFLAGSQAATTLADISYEVTLRKTESIPNAESKRKKWLDIPAFLVALVHENQRALPLEEASTDEYMALPYTPPETERQLEDYAAASAAVQNVLLSLHSEGIGSKWATGPVIKTPAFRKLVQASPTDRVVALVMVGGTTEFGSEREAYHSAVRRHRRRPIQGNLLVDLA